MPAQPVVEDDLSEEFAQFGYAKLTLSQLALLHTTVARRTVVDWGCGREGLLATECAKSAASVHAIDYAGGKDGRIVRHEGNLLQLSLCVGSVELKPREVSLLSWPINQTAFTGLVMPHLRKSLRIVLIGCETGGLVIGCKDLWRKLHQRELLRCIRAEATGQFIAVYGGFIEGPLPTYRYQEEKLGAHWGASYSDMEQWQTHACFMGLDGK